MKSALSQVLAAAALMTVLASSARAAVTVTFQEVGSDVVATASGSFISWSGLATGFTNAGNNQALSSSAPQVGMGNQASGSWNANVYLGYLGSGGSWISKPSNLGLTNFNYYSANVNTGAYNFFVNGNGIYIQQSYTLGTQLDNVSTWTNQTFNNLGIAEGIYTWAWAGDSFSVVVGNPIPEPSTYGLILGGLALAGAAMRRRKLKI